MSRERRRSLWQHWDFRRFWIGDTASQLGFALGSLAVPYMAVTSLRATQFDMGVLGTLGGLGFLVVGLPAGAIIDRRSKRQVMISADLGRAVLLATLPLAWWWGILTIAQLIVVATTVGILTVFFDVSYQSYLPLLVNGDQVVEGNGKLQASQSVSQASGPAVGGLLLTRLGPSTVIGINAIGYLASACCVWRIRHREQVHPVAAEQSMVADMAEGLHFVLGHPLLRRLVTCTGIANFAGSATTALAVLYMVRELNFSALEIGIVDSAMAVGGLLGALITAPVTRRFGEGPAIGITAISMMLLSFCYPLSAALAPVATLIIGGSGMMAAVVAYNITTVSFRQRLCPPRLLGRMNASARFLVWGTIPLGAFAGGVLGTAIGVIPTLWTAAGFGCLAVLPLCTPSLWRLRELPRLDDHTSSDSPLTPTGDR